LGLLALSADDPDGWGIGGCIPRTVNTALDKVRMAVNVKKKLLSAA